VINVISLLGTNTTPPYRYHNNRAMLHLLQTSAAKLLNCLQTNIMSYICKLLKPRPKALFLTQLKLVPTSEPKLRETSINMKNK